MTRQQMLDSLADNQPFDITILGGGINGACLYDALCRRGYRTLLLDQGDFASGTSQSSGMMIWGGLLYLRTFDVGEVIRLSRDRDHLIADHQPWVACEGMRYIPSSRIGSWRAHCALWLYWLLGGGRRRGPALERHFPEQTLFKTGVGDASLTFEEAFLDQSDARFVFRWLACPRPPGQVALNYCSATGDYARREGMWRLSLTDHRGKGSYETSSRLVVNCAGVWSDRVNAAFGISSPYRHALSKGVYLVIRRPEQHKTSLFFELGAHDDVICLVPWGPVSLWGPTETAIQDIEEGRQANSQDIDYLLEQYVRRFRQPLRRSEVVALRCGIRPLVVDRGFSGDSYPLALSRRQEIVADADRPWISCYGGKLTGAPRMAASILRLIERRIAASGEIPVHNTFAEQRAPSFSFPGLEKPVPTPSWCAEHEACCTLEDYLRRRTNIAQWVERGGLGTNDANAAVLRAIAVDIADGDTLRGNTLFEHYRQSIQTHHDSLLTLEPKMEHP